MINLVLLLIIIIKYINIDDLSICITPSNSILPYTKTIRTNIQIGNDIFVNPTIVNTISQNPVYIYNHINIIKERIVVKYINQNDNEINVIKNINKNVFNECSIINAKVIESYIVGDDNPPLKIVVMPYIKYNFLEYYKIVKDLQDYFPSSILGYILLQVANNLNCLINKGIKYIDLKPENILIENNLLSSSESSTSSSLSESKCSLKVYICDLGGIIFDKYTVQDVQYTLRAPFIDLKKITEKDMIWYIGFTVLRLFLPLEELKILHTLGNIVSFDLVNKYDIIIDSLKNKMEPELFTIISKCLIIHKEERCDFIELINNLDKYIEYSDD